MPQKSVSYRLGLEGGEAVKVAWRDIGKEGQAAFRKIDKAQRDAAREAARTQRQLAQEERAFRALRASIDPVYAAQQRMARVQTQLNRAVEKGITDQRTANTILQQAQAQYRGLGTAVETVNTAAVRSNQGLRNSLLQVNQIGQQAAATGNLMGAVAIQLPDILAGFGGLPALFAGAAVGLAAAFIPALVSGRQETERFKEVIDALATSLSNVDSAQSAAAESIFSLNQKYGENARLVQEALLAQQRIRELEAQRALDAASVALSEAFLKNAEAYRQAGYEAQVTEEILRRVLSTTNATNEEALALTDALEQLASAQGPQEQVSAIGAVKDALLDATDGVRNMDAATLAVYNSLVDAEIAAAQLAAVDVASNMYDGADAAAQLAQNANAAAIALSRVFAQQSKVYSGRGGDPRKFTDGPDYQNEAGYTPVSELIVELSPKPVKRRSSGGGRKGGGGGAAKAAAAAQKELNEATREAERIFNATRTAQERYNQEVAKADELLKKGLISQDTYARHMDDLKEKLDQASQANQQFQKFTTMRNDAVINAILGQKDAFEQLKQAIIRATLEYALFQTVAGKKVEGGLPGFGKALFGSLFSFDGGGDTPAGPRSGGLDGKGGFLAVMHPNERVIDKTRGAAPRSAPGQQMVPFVGIGDGVQVKWLKQADLRSAQQLGSFAQAQAQGFGPALQEFNARGTL